MLYQRRKKEQGAVPAGMPGELYTDSVGIVGEYDTQNNWVKEKSGEKIPAASSIQIQLYQTIRPKV